MENKMDLQEYLEEKEELEMTKRLEEDAAAVIGSVLGYGAVGLIAAFGGTLLALGGVKAVSALTKLWRKIIGTAKGIRKTPTEVIREVKADTLVKKEKAKIETAEDRYRDELQDVLKAIAEKDLDTAKVEFDALSPSIRNLPDVRKVIIADLTKVFGEPPMYVTSPGNVTYKAIKTILGIKTARAAAMATEMAIKGSTKTEENNEVENVT
jgi:hypothetical protein